MKFQVPDCKTCHNRKHSIFHFCDMEEIDELDEKKSGYIFRKGEIVFNEGGMPLGVYCIQSGKVKIVKKNNEGREQIIRLAKGSDLIGFRSLLANTTYSSSAIAMEDSVICFIPKVQFEVLRHTNSGFEQEVIKRLTSALGDAEERMATMSLKPVRERLAESLLVLNKLYNTDVTGDWFIISRDDLGSLVGTAKETAIRILSDFKEENIVQTHGSKIRIVDQEQLLKISQLHD